MTSFSPQDDLSASVLDNHLSIQAAAEYSGYNVLEARPDGGYSSHQDRPDVARRGGLPERLFEGCSRDR